ncbi:hypothetical protein GCM10029992_54890 [Glycomyces albus]
MPRTSASSPRVTSRARRTDSAASPSAWCEAISNSSDSTVNWWPTRSCSSRAIRSRSWDRLESASSAAAARSRTFASDTRSRASPSRAIASRLRYAAAWSTRYSIDPIAASSADGDGEAETAITAVLATIKAAATIGRTRVALKAALNTSRIAVHPKPGAVSTSTGAAAT